MLFMYTRKKLSKCNLIGNSDKLLKDIAKELTATLQRSLAKEALKLQILDEW